MGMHGIFHDRRHGRVVWIDHGIPFFLTFDMAFPMADDMFGQACRIAFVSLYFVFGK